MLASKKQNFLETRILTSVMSKANKYARLGDELNLRSTIFNLDYYVNRRCLITGRTMLVEAAGAGHLHIVRMLCREFKASPRTPTIMGNATALHVAVQNNFRQIAAMLITHGGDTNARDNQLATPMHYVQSIAVLKTLVRFGGDVLAKTRKGHTPLEYYQMMIPLEEQDPDLVADMEGRMRKARMKTRLDLPPSPPDSDEDRPATRANQVRKRAPPKDA